MFQDWQYVVLTFDKLLIDIVYSEKLLSLMHSFSCAFAFEFAPSCFRQSLLNASVKSPNIGRFYF